MLWARKSKLAKNIEPSPLMIGLDLNASRASAVEGLGQATPRVLPLDHEQNDLALVLNLEGRQPQVGREAAAICRRSPHLLCQDFLASLGEPREWAAGRHRLDASKALGHTVERLKPACGHGRGLVVAVPPYLSRQQVALLTPLFEKGGMPLLGTLKSPLALALVAHAASPWSGQALVIDIDDHALWATSLVTDGAQLWIQRAESWPRFNLHAWKIRLLNAVADRCIRQSRRDPRDCASAEQALYDQLEPALYRAREGKSVELLVQTERWYQNLSLPPEEMAAFCRQLGQQALELLRDFIASAADKEPPGRLLISGPASRLPGLVPALESMLEQGPSIDVPPLSGDDFGEALLPVGAEAALVTPLADNAAACGAHDLAVRIHGGELARGHFEAGIRLPRRESTPDRTDPGRRVRIYSAEPDC